MASQQCALAVCGGAKVATPETSPAPQMLRTELLVEFCRALIQGLPSRDLLALSLVQAKNATGATDGEVRLLAEAVLHEADKAPWPKGFF